MFDYYLIYREKKKPELILAIGEGKEPIAKLSGKSAKHVFNRILDNPSIWEAIELIKSDKTKIYGIRQDIAPIIASYILLNRRSPRPEKWDWYLKEVLDGKLSKAGKSISAIVELTFVLSNEFEFSKSMDIIAGMLKEFAKRIDGYSTSK